MHGPNCNYKKVEQEPICQITGLKYNYEIVKGCFCKIIVA
jgi:hypothetical protein